LYNIVYTHSPMRMHGVSCGLRRRAIRPPWDRDLGHSPAHSIIPLRRHVRSLRADNGSLHLSAAASDVHASSSPFTRPGMRHRMFLLLQSKIANEEAPWQNYCMISVPNGASARAPAPLAAPPPPPPVSVVFSDNKALVIEQRSLHESFGMLRCRNISSHAACIPKPSTSRLILKSHLAPADPLSLSLQRRPCD
jgi:hypothetical protein